MTAVSTFKPIQSREPITEAQLRMIAGALGPIQSMVLDLGNVEIRAGAGIIDRNTKCLWTKGKLRITFNMSNGCFAGSLSHEPDPAYQEN